MHVKWMIMQWLLLHRTAATAAAAVSTVGRAALPLLQQLQRCGPLLPNAAATMTREIASMHHQHQIVQVMASKFLSVLSASYAELVERLDLQHELAADVFKTCRLQVDCLLSDPAAVELLLQLLAVQTMLLHQQRTKYQQRTQQLQRPSGQSSSSSSSSSSRSSRPQCKGQLRADLLFIPAFHRHQDMLRLLPAGGQAYLDAAAALHRMAAADTATAAAETLVGCTSEAVFYVNGLSVVVSCAAEHQTLSSDSPVLSAAAVRLVLELQLLASWAVQQEQQQQQQQQQQQPQSSRSSTVLLRINELLHIQLKSLLCASGGCLPPWVSELLQQHGLQLLQALAAPVQQLLLSGPSEALSNTSNPRQAAYLQCLQQQMFVFRAAAVGADFPAGKVSVAGCS
jgi:hypothetical protein